MHRASPDEIVFTNTVLGQSIGNATERLSRLGTAHRRAGRMAPSQRPPIESTTEMSRLSAMYRQRAAQAKQSAPRAKNPWIKSAFEERRPAGSYLPSNWSGLTGNGRGRLGRMSRK